MSRFERARLVVKVIEVRLRFIAVLVITAVVIGKWDSIANHWEKWTRKARGAREAVAADKELFCPMHPTVVRTSLGPDGSVPKCPICGMPLSIRPRATSGGVATQGRVQLSPERITLAGAKIAVVGWKRLEQEVVTQGSVQIDEGRLSRIVARVNGYIEKLHIDKSYIRVEKGEPLALVYSPELYTAVRELLLTRQDPRSPLAAASRERLRLLGVDEQEIDRIVASGSSDYRITIRSPQSGHVIERSVVQGSYVTVGTSLFLVADLSSVWIEGYVYEKDLPFLREGATIEAWVEAVPNKVFMGTVALVHPHVDAQTRTATVRFTVDNRAHLLSPGMSATVRIRTPLADLPLWKSAAKEPDVAIVNSGSVLAVPERAVIDTGSKKVVYKESEPGVFEAVRVDLGPRVGDDFPVLSGLRAGDRVASAGSFLIDAETRLNPAAGATYGGQGNAIHGAACDPKIDPDSWRELSPEDRRLALEQGTCPVSGDRLGVMGTPFKTIVNGKPVFLCCDGCKPELEKKAVGEK